MKIKIEVNEANQILIYLDEVLKRVLTVNVTDDSLTVYVDQVSSSGKIRKPLGYMLGSNCLINKDL